MGLVSQAPELIFQVLETRRQRQQEQAGGESARAILGSLAQEGRFGQELLSALEASGGEVQPGSGPLQGSTIPQLEPQMEQTGDLAVPERPPESATVGGTPGTGPQVDVSGIDPRNAQNLLQQFLATQESISGIEAQQATTALRGEQAELTEAQIPGALADSRRAQIEADVAEATAPFQERAAELENELTEARISNNEVQARRAEAQIEDIRRQREERIIRGAEELMNTDFEQFRRWTQTFSQIPGTDAASAKQMAARATFGSNQIPSPSEWRERKRAVLRGDAPGPTEEQRRTQIAGRLGVPPQLQSAIDQGIAQFDTMDEAWEAYRERIEQSTSLSEEQKAQRILLGGLYMEALSGKDLGLRKETKKRKGILRKLMESMTGPGTSFQENPTLKQFEQGLAGQTTGN